MVLIGCAHINAGCLRTYEVPSGKCNVYLTKNRSLEDLQCNFTRDKLDYLVVIDNNDLNMTTPSILYKKFYCKTFAEHSNIISPLVARLNYALKVINENKFFGQYLIIITVTNDYREIHILKKQQPTYNLIKDIKEIKNVKNLDILVNNFSSSMLGAKFLVLYDTERKPEFKIDNSDVLYSKFQMWDTMLLEGGMYKALMNRTKSEDVKLSDFIPPVKYKNEQYTSNIINKYETIPIGTTRQTINFKVGSLEIFEDAELTFDIKNGYSMCSRILLKVDITETGNYDVEWKTDDLGVCIFSAKKHIYSKKLVFVNQTQSINNTMNNFKNTTNMMQGNCGLVKNNSGSDISVASKKDATLYSVKAKETTKSGYNESTKKFMVPFAYQLFSGNYVYTDKNGKTVFNKIKSTPLSSSDWADKKAAERCNSLFDEIPNDVTPSCIVLIHDGSFERKYVKEAYQKCLKRSNNVKIISEVMAYLMVAASKITLSDLKENEILGILFIISLNGYAYYLRRTNDKLVLFQENKYTMYELQKKDYGRLKDILYSNAKKGPAIIVSDNIIDQKLKSKMPNNYKYLEVENYGRAVYDGALMKSQFMSGITPKFMEVADFCGPTFYELPGKPLFKIFDPYQILPYCNSYDIEGISDRITIFQRKAILSEKRYLLLEEKLELGAKYKLNIAAEASGIVRVDIRKHETMVAGFKINLPKIPSEPSKDALKCLKGGNACVIRLMFERNEISAEGLRNGRYTYVPTVFGTNSISDSVSLVDKPVVGQAALNSYGNNPEYVIQGIINKINACKTSKEMVRKNNEIYIECRTKFGKRLIPLHIVVAILLKAVIKMAGRYFNTKIKHVFFAMPMSYKGDQVDQLRKACNVAGIRWAGSTQFSSSFYTV